MLSLGRSTLGYSLHTHPCGTDVQDWRTITERIFARFVGNGKIYQFFCTEGLSGNSYCWLPRGFDVSSPCQCCPPMIDRIVASYWFCIVPFSTRLSKLFQHREVGLKGQRACEAGLLIIGCRDPGAARFALAPDYFISRLQREECFLVLFGD